MRRTLLRGREQEVVGTRWAALLSGVVNRKLGDDREVGWGMAVEG